MTGRRWEDAEVEHLRELAAQPFSYAQIAECFPGRTLDSIELKLASLGLARDSRFSAVQVPHLDPEPKTDMAQLAELAAKAYAEGHDFRIERGQLQLGSVEHDREVVIDSGKTCHRFAIVSDTHAGSYFAQESALRHFVRYATGRGKHPDTGERIKPVDFIVHPGDLTQGADKMHRDQPFQIHVHGADQQIDYAARTLPEAGVPWYVIGGKPRRLVRGHQRRAAHLL